ncbi:hypothetical protein MMC13_005982 [Lambiella insularis]|nr:hypothetical protein [Lambiella insularis]
MTDLLHILPNFSTTGYTHLIPSLEKHLITCTDILTLEATDLAKRAQLPVLDVRNFAADVLVQLQSQQGLHNIGDKIPKPGTQNVRRSGKDGVWGKSGKDLLRQWSIISTLNSDLDTAVGGGLPTGYITEVTGERYLSIKRLLLSQYSWLFSGAGKTQLLLTLLLSAQLPSPHGLSRPSIYISTEHPLPTTRLTQLLNMHPLLASVPQASRPSLSRILTLQTPDLESQDHILTYQLPVVLAQYSPALIVIDSIAANYRAETSSLTTTPSIHPAALAQRSSDLVRLGETLRSLAREYDCAIVVANQVGDRFGPAVLSPKQVSSQLNRITSGEAFSSSPILAAQGLQQSSPFPTSQSHHSAQLQLTAAPATAPAPSFALHPSLLSLDHQYRFFTGWGDSPPASLSSQRHFSHDQNLKIPSLGLVWANQIACRIALVKEPAYLHQSRPGLEAASGLAFVDDTDRNHQNTAEMERAEWAPRGWKRWMRVVFAPWVAGVRPDERGVEFEIWAGGIKAVKERDGGHGS